MSRRTMTITHFVLFGNMSAKHARRGKNSCNIFLPKVMKIAYINTMEKILVSACLLGDMVRYNGKQLPTAHPLLQQWHAEGRLVKVCPEVSGGLPVPRPPAEIIRGDGTAVLAGNARIQTEAHRDVTNQYLYGAREALRLAGQFRIKLAILKENSPSCGKGFIYDGAFSRIKKPGQGVTAASLSRHGIEIFNENEILQAAAFLQKLEHHGD